MGYRHDHWVSLGVPSVIMDIFAETDFRSLGARLEAGGEVLRSVERTEYFSDGSYEWLQNLDYAAEPEYGGDGCAYLLAEERPEYPG